MSASASKAAVVYGNNKTETKGSSGWAVFDRKHRQNQHGPEVDTEPYPLLSGSKQTQVPVPTLHKQPFTSVVLTPRLRDLQINENQTEVYQKLSHLYPFADTSLIQDVLAAVNNNIQEALSLLEAMLAASDDTDAMNNNTTTYSSYGNHNDTTSLNFTDDGCVESNHDTSTRMLIDWAPKSLPIEPEFHWEEDDDIYLIHRKDAIKMIRSASRHSKASNDAYLRGDHLSAQSFSLKAQEEWTAADKLNALAAKDILTLRNCNNDMWTLDLHGLHAAEAVQALQERLQKIESLVSSNYLVAQSEDYKEPKTVVSASVQSTSHAKVKTSGQQPLSTRRPRLLQAITGKGIHSRGAAALPSAIRNFLSENGYHFDETRSGVIVIRPKFRQQIVSL